MHTPRVTYRPFRPLRGTGDLEQEAPLPMPAGLRLLQARGTGAHRRLRPRVQPVHDHHGVLAVQPVLSSGRTPRPVQRQRSQHARQHQCGDGQGGERPQKRARQDARARQGERGRQTAFRPLHPTAGDAQPSHGPGRAAKPVEDDDQVRHPSDRDQQPRATRRDEKRDARQTACERERRSTRIIIAEHPVMPVAPAPRVLPTLLPLARRARVAEPIPAGQFAPPRHTGRGQRTGEQHHAARQTERQTDKQRQPAYDDERHGPVHGRTVIRLAGRASTGSRAGTINHASRLCEAAHR